MSIRELTEDCLFVTLSKYPSRTHELAKLNQSVSENPVYDIIIDFSLVKMLTSTSLANFLALRGLLIANNRRLIFCHVVFPVKGIFTVCGFTEVFEFAQDKFAALEALKCVEQPG